VKQRRTVHERPKKGKNAGHGTKLNSPLEAGRYLMDAKLPRAAIHASLVEEFRSRRSISPSLQARRVMQQLGLIKAPKKKKGVSAGLPKKGSPPARRIELSLVALNEEITHLNESSARIKGKGAKTKRLAFQLDLQELRVSANETRTKLRQMGYSEQEIKKIK